MKNLTYVLFGVIAALLWTLLLLSTMVDKQKAIAAAYGPNVLGKTVEQIIDSTQNKELKRKIDSLQRLLNKEETHFFISKRPRPKVEHFGYGREIKYLSQPQLKAEMIKRGFRNLEGLNLFELRRVYLVWSYDPLLWDVNRNTGLPVSVLFSYFIIESTKNGLETDLLYLYGNCGGIKANGRVSESALFFDDCFDSKGRKIRCKFAVIKNYDQLVQVWSDVFNLPRYKKCRSAKGSNAELTRLAVCQCLKKGGYHTATGKIGKDGIGSHVKARANLAGDYWQIRSNHFPNQYFWAGQNL